MTQATCELAILRVGPSDKGSSPLLEVLCHFSPRRAEELDRPTVAADSRKEVLLLVSEGQEVRVAEALAIRRRPPTAADS